MKNALIFSLIALFVMNSPLLAQEDKSKRPSPPAEISGTCEEADIRINYSTPAVKGRTVWGGLVPYGKVWRTGANEATVFETSKNLKIAGQTLPAGKYALFTIPGETEWTFILNSDWNQWGTFKYDQAKDVLRFNVPAEHSPTFNERLKFEIAGNRVDLYWENLKVGFPIGDAAQVTAAPARVSPPATAMASFGDAKITINYSQPSVKGRTIWGGLVPYGQVWRTGANEATTFEVNKDIMISGKHLPAGKYAMFTIPGENEWTVIFNKDWNQWGAFKYDQSQDALRVNVKPGRSMTFNEQMMFDLSDYNVVLLWENLQLTLPVKSH